MFELTVETEFCAAHAIEIAGQCEAMHGHNWHVTATVAAPSLDDDGLVCDFHELERQLRSIIAPLENTDLNTTPPFDNMNPTAEHVALHIGRELAATLPTHVQLQSVSVTEAPRCRATYRP